MPSQLDLLIEIGTEELPPKALKSLSETFTQLVTEGLESLNLKRSSVKSFATPRRLAMIIYDLDTAQPASISIRKGPSISAAYDENGIPTKAAEGFARSCGVSVTDLETSVSESGSWLVFNKTEQGSPTRDLIPEVVDKALAGLPIPKRMRWGNRNDEFVRPVHWTVILFGNEVVPATILGCESENATRGHRFHHPSKIYVGTPAEYEHLLETKGFVVPDFAKRKAMISKQIHETASSLGATAIVDDYLLDEVTSLNEWPSPVLGSFDDSFLALPPECLIQAMQGHQKFFPVADSVGRLLPHFITITNIESNDVQQIRAGNERVIRPRFKDAAFFWEQDIKRPLDQRIDSLKSITFQAKLGTLYDKTERLALIAEVIAEELGTDNHTAIRSARLCKCDLMTDMVGEFPKLQGIMGRYYALHSGESPEVASTMEEVYLPKHAGDVLPSSVSGRIIAIADRIDTLVGIFSIGQAPTGAKDPYGLRRAAIGVLRIMIETPLDIDLYKIIVNSASFYKDISNPDLVVEQVFEYMLERLKGYYSELQIPPDTIDAVLSLKPTNPHDIDQRINAVTEFRHLSEAISLSAANKRIRNILKKSENEIIINLSDISVKEPAEQDLYKCLQQLSPEVEPLFDQRKYEEGLKLLAILKNPVDAFFDQVMVMVDDENVRFNRLALLRQMEKLFMTVADFSRLQ